MENKKLTIRLDEYHYTCGDGCCDNYGTTVFLNEEEVIDSESTEQILEAILSKIGYQVSIEHTYSGLYSDEN